MNPRGNCSAFGTNRTPSNSDIPKVGTDKTDRRSFDAHRRANTDEYNMNSHRRPIFFPRKVSAGRLRKRTVFPPSICHGSNRYSTNLWISSMAIFRYLNGQVSGLPLIRMPSGVLPSEYRDPATQKTEWFRCKIDGMAINPHIVTLD